MKNEYLELIDELNEQLLDNKFTENLGMSFNYVTNGYCHQINFGDIGLYCSESNSLSKWDDLQNDYIDVSLKEFIITEFNIFKDELFKIDLK